MFDPTHNLIDLKGVETVLTNSPIRKLSERKRIGLILTLTVGMGVLSFLCLFWLWSLFNSTHIVCENCNAEISINGRKIEFERGSYDWNPIWRTYELEYKKRGKTRKWILYPHDASNDSGIVYFEKDEIMITIKNEEITNR